MKFSEEQVIQLAPDDASIKAGRALSGKGNWLVAHFNEKVLWGEIKGSGAKPYLTQVDLTNIAFKCSCPSRKFPCKHGIALLLLSVKDATAVTANSVEPQWVQDWINKRNEAALPKEEKVVTEEQIAKQEKAKEKRAQERSAGVQVGIDEIGLVLEDTMRQGLIQLANMDASFFDNLNKRMIDAKATGLANYVKRIEALKYRSADQQVQSQTLRLIAELFFIIETYKNINNIEPIWQETIKNIIGWSQSPKELQDNRSVEPIDDEWLVAGQEVITNDEITIHKTWLLGLKTNSSALLLNFITKFSILEQPLIAGSVIQGSIKYFPSVWPQRAVIAQQTKVENSLVTMPTTFSDIDQALQYKNSILVAFPLANDVLVAIANLYIVQRNGIFVAVDQEQCFIEFHATVLLETKLQWLATSAGRPCRTIALLREGLIVPLGVIVNDKYEIL